MPPRLRMPSPSPSPSPPPPLPSSLLPPSLLRAPRTLVLPLCTDCADTDAPSSLAAPPGPRPAPLTLGAPTRAGVCRVPAGTTAASIS